LDKACTAVETISDEHFSATGRRALRHSPGKPTRTLVLLRHGQSVWNQENLFTGWTDIDLTEQGVREAREAGAQLAAGGYSFDVCFTSVLKRASRRCILRSMRWISCGCPSRKTGG
jgi:hypothetical protein